jgi:hypothetical protein
LHPLAKDVFDFSGVANGELTGLINVNSINVLVIQGTASDTVELAALPEEHPAAAGAWTDPSTAQTTDIDGQTYKLLEYEDSGNILATLAVDQDITIII